MTAWKWCHTTETCLIGSNVGEFHFVFCLATVTFNMLTGQGVDVADLTRVL